VDIGMVREISLNPKNLNQVRLLLAIENSIPIKTDTIAELMSQGITGLSFIDLSGGSNGAPLLTIKDDERYPVIKTQHSLYFRLDNAARDITDAIKTASTDLHVIMGKEN
jgi:phospholipid/cholesterol/gamma-HCH transport system substrate-binding protein